MSEVGTWRLGEPERAGWFQADIVYVVVLYPDPHPQGQCALEMLTVNG